MDRKNRTQSTVEYDHEWEGGSGPLVVGRAGYERSSAPIAENRDASRDEANSDLGNTGRDTLAMGGEIR